jgi:hypothetical protein
MRPQWDDIAVIQGSILVGSGDLVIARSGETIQQQTANRRIASLLRALRRSAVAVNAGAALTAGTRSPKRHHGLVDFVC